MSTAEAALAEARDLARMMVVVSERARADFATAVAPFGVPLQTARALLVLTEPQSMRHVAAELGFDPSHVTGIADDLERRGLAVRIPGKDRRVKLLQLTDDGEALRRRIAAAVDEQARFARQLDAEQKRQLREILEALLTTTD
ncbi:MarR family winged helix-turn-helix transcriptional regulator [Brachybacterium sp. DNPG3]